MLDRTPSWQKPLHYGVIVISIIAVTYITVWAVMISLYLLDRPIHPRVASIIAMAMDLHVAVILLAPIPGWLHIYLLFRRSVTNVVTGAIMGGVATLNLVLLSFHPEWNNPAPWVTFAVWFSVFAASIALARSPYFRPPNSAPGHVVARALTLVFGPTQLESNQDQDQRLSSSTDKFQ